MIRVSDVLSSATRLGLDTSLVVYYVENVLPYHALCTPFFAAIASGRLEGVTATLTLTEALSHPLKSGDGVRAQAFHNLLLLTRGIRTIALSDDIAEKAAELRAKYGLKTPDAVSVASAIAAGCDAFLTNDVTLKRVQEIAVYVLGELTL